MLDPQPTDSEQVSLLKIASRVGATVSGGEFPYVLWQKIVRALGGAVNGMENKHTLVRKTAKLWGANVDGSEFESVLLYKSAVALGATVDPGDESEWLLYLIASNVGSTPTPTPTPTPTLPALSPVTGLTAVDNGFGGIDISWTNPASVPVGINIVTVDVDDVQTSHGNFPDSPTTISRVPGTYDVYATNKGDGVTNLDSATESVLGVVVTPTVDLLVDFASGSGAVSPTNIAAAEVGGMAGAWDYIVGRANPLVMTTIETMSVTRKWPLACAGANHQTVARVIKMDLTAGSDWEGLKRSIPSGHPNVTQTLLIQTDADGSSGLDVIHIDGGTYAVGQVESGHFNAHSQNGGGTTRGHARDVPDTSLWYIMTVRYNSDGDIAELVVINNDTGAVVVVSEAPAAFSGADATQFLIQNYLVGTGTLRIALPALNLAGDFPLDPITLPDPTSFAVTQTGVSEATLTWFGVTQRYKIERQLGAGSFSAIAANLDIGLGQFTYVDPTVADGSAYTYRISALGAGLTSAATTSSPIAINDTAPTLSSATIATTGNTLTLVFSTAISFGGDGGNDFTLTASGGAVTGSYSSGTGTSTLVYITSRSVASGETVTLDYTQPGDGAKNARNILLATFSGASVTNNSTSGGGGSLLYDEGFEGTGTPTDMFLTGGADPDATASPATGSQFLRLPNGETMALPSGGSATFPSPAGIDKAELYWKFSFRVSALPASFAKFVEASDSADRVLFGLYILADGTITVSDEAGSTIFTSTVSAISANTWYDVECHYAKGTGSNGVCSVGFVALGGTIPTAGNAFAGGTNSPNTTNVRTINLEGRGGIPNTDFDNLKVSSAFI